MTTKNSLVGKFFHSFIGKKMNWQGHIIDYVDGMYLVQLFSWWDGHPTNQVLVDFKKMKNWKFYDNQDQWMEAGDKSTEKDLGTKRLMSSKEWNEMEKKSFE